MGFVRASKYRHAFGTAAKRDQCYDNLRVSRSAWDTNLVDVNPLYLAVNLESQGGGAFSIIPLGQVNYIDKVGKSAENAPVVNGHTAAVLDTSFNPFNDSIIASASEDCKAMVWKIPDGGLTETLTTPVVVLSGHGRKVGHVLFNPAADNILATTSTDFTIKTWDISTGQEKFQLEGFTEIIQSIAWSAKGNLMLTSCKDKKIRIYDVRSRSIAVEGMGHLGVKGSRITPMGDSEFFCTTGFSKTSERQVFVWDSKNLSKPLVQESIDTASGMLIPYFDPDTNLLYLAGKGDGNIRYYEWEQGQLYYLEQYKSSESLRGLAFLPKRACAINECEVARIFKVHPTMVEPISFKVPRKADTFQADLFPDTFGGIPAMTAQEWLSGKTAAPKLISLEKGFVPQAPKEFVTTAEVPVTTASKAPMSEKEYQESYHAMKKECEELQSQLASRDARIRQLEAQLASMETK